VRLFNKPPPIHLHQQLRRAGHRRHDHFTLAYRHRDCLKLSDQSLSNHTALVGHMDSSLHEVWQAAAGSPFLPAVGKGSQFLVGFVLLLLGVAITAFFALSKLLTSAC
jgi:hypothetical protein